MKAFVDQRKAKPVFRRHAAAASAAQAGWERSLQRGQIRQILDSPRPQFKLTVGAPNDIYEQEADRVAAEVMRMTDPAGSSERAQRMCTECEDEVQREPEEEEELQAEFVGEPLQREVDEEVDEELVGAKEIPGQTPVVSPEVEGRINSMRGGGQPLPESERHFFEPRFGHDFGRIRIHSDSGSNAIAQSVHARAFTLGSDIVFGSGEYQPNSPSSKKLLAHELTHVIQQGQARQQKVVRRSPKEEKVDKARQEALKAVVDIESRWQVFRAAKQKELVRWIGHGDQVVKLIRQHTERALAASAANEFSTYAAYKHVLKTDLIAYQFISWHTVVLANLIALKPQLMRLIDSFDADGRAFTGRAQNEAFVRDLYKLSQVFPGQAAAALKWVGTGNTISVRVGSFPVSITGTTAADPKIAEIFKKEIASLSRLQWAIQVGTSRVNAFLSTARAEGLAQAGDAIIQFLLMRGGKGKGKGRGPKTKGKTPAKKSSGKGSRQGKQKDREKGKKQDKEKGKRKGKWTCFGRSFVLQIPSALPNRVCPPWLVNKRIDGPSMSAGSQGAACGAAKTAFNTLMRDGCKPKHVKCVCSKR